MTRTFIPTLLANAALILVCAAAPARAESSDVAALEARVAELEAMLKELLGDKRKEPPQATPSTDQATSTYAFGGYVKFDTMFSDYSGGDLAPGSIGTQFYVPAAIPVGGTAGEGPDTDVQGRESRIHFKSNHALANGHEIGTYFELDFFLGSGGNERVSNSYNPRLRHVFFKFDNWLFGQTWSTFQDVGALPENLDFIGPSESTTFIRQPQIRYTSGNWEFAVENPESTITPFGGGARIVTDDGAIPDIVARYTASLDNGYVKIAGLARQLNIENGGIDDDEIGLGLSLSGKHAFGRDDIRWMATIGSGTGRYLGLNTANDAVLDSNGRLQAIDQWGAFVSYRHFWNELWRSNFTFGYLENDHDTSLTGTSVTKDVYSIHANLLYSPIPKMTVGGELLFAERSLESGASGDMTRFLFSAKYAF